MFPKSCRTIQASRRRDIAGSHGQPSRAALLPSRRWAMDLMRAATRFVTSYFCLLTLASAARAESTHSIPIDASIAFVRSRFDGVLVRTGDVKVAFRDGHTEILTHTGDCHEAKVSPAGKIGWIRTDKKNIDLGRLILTGTDSLNIRMLDRTVKEFPPFEENVCIMQWRFTDNETAVAVRSMGHHGPSSYVKYEISTAKVLDSRGPSYTPYDELPTWAKPLADPKND